MVVEIIRSVKENFKFLVEMLLVALFMLDHLSWFQEDSLNWNIVAFLTPTMFEV